MLTCKLMIDPLLTVIGLNSSLIDPLSQLTFAFTHQAHSDQQAQDLTGLIKLTMLCACCNQETSSSFEQGTQLSEQQAGWTSSHPLNISRSHVALWYGHTVNKHSERINEAEFTVSPTLIISFNCTHFKLTQPLNRSHGTPSLFNNPCTWICFACAGPGCGFQHKLMTGCNEDLRGMLRLPHSIDWHAVQNS